MSTKIYTAYKLKNPEYFETWLKKTVLLTRQRAREAFVDCFIRYHNPEMLKEEISKKATKGDSPKLALLHLIHLLHEKYREVALKYYRSFYYFGLELAIYLHKGQYYIIPHSDALNKVFDFLKEDKDLYKYGYWNNVDEPEDVSDKEWEQRKNDWNEIFDEDVEPMMIEIVSVMGFLKDLDIYDGTVDAILEELKTRGIIEEG